MKGETIFMLLLLGGAAYLLYSATSGASSAATTTVTDYSVANPYSNPYLQGSGEVPITSTGPLPANYGPQV
jgi:threonine/homoserine/homoserine lactone efflux protein